jgi:hypothetical protein
MKRVHISYANEKFAKSLELLEKTSREVGQIDNFIPYTREWLITTDFYTKNRYILDKPRGSGYFIWKPGIILETFKKLEKGDVVLYSDAGLTVINSLSPLFKIMENHPNDGKMLFKLPAVGTTHKAKMWTKRDCFVLIKILEGVAPCNADSEVFWNADMTNGAISLWEYNDENVEFLKEWQRYLRDPRISTDDNNMCGPNFSEFKDHRHDQSVLTILSKKWEILNNKEFELFCDPTQFGNGVRDQFFNSPYGQLFNHHRGNI